MSGYVFVTATGACASCTTGVAGTATFTAFSLGCTTCSYSGTALSCSVCAGGYVLSGTSCVSCTNTNALVGGIPNCWTCSATTIAGATTANTFVTCSVCAAGYSLYPVTATTGKVVTTPFCYLASAGTTVTTAYPVNSANVPEAVTA